jgi:hypothetical protein
MVPFGLLIGSAAIDLAGLRRSSASAQRLIPLIGAGVLVVALVLEGLAGATTIFEPGTPVHALDAARRSAMDLVSGELPGHARVAVITGGEWSGDSDSEWFPQLTGRQSVATVQGSEWLGSATFDARVQRYRSLQDCAEDASANCVVLWLDEHPADYVYVPTEPIRGPRSGPCCVGLDSALRKDIRFQIVLISPGATVFAVR